MNKRKKTKFESLTKNYKDSQLGDYKIKVFSLSEQEVRREQFKDLLDGTCEVENLISGDYVKLIDTKKKEIVMSNTNMEEVTNKGILENSKGSLLIGGLGLGLIIQVLQDKKCIDSITIIEKDKDLIKLVTSQIKFNNKVNIVCDDIFKYKPVSKFDYIYFDIWNLINGDNYKEMLRLHQRYEEHGKSKDSIIDSWRFEDCKELHEGEKVFIQLLNEHRRYN